MDLSAIGTSAPVVTETMKAGSWLLVADPLELACQWAFGWSSDSCRHAAHYIECPPCSALLQDSRLALAIDPTSLLDLNSSCAVLVMLGYSVAADMEIYTIQEWVMAGGGLLLGGHEWGSNPGGEGQGGRQGG